jgi:hypothetical protein
LHPLIETAHRRRSIGVAPRRCFSARAKCLSEIDKTLALSSRSNKKRCDTLSDIAPIRASRSSVKTVSVKAVLFAPFD